MAMKALIVAPRNSRIGDYPGQTPAACVEILGAPLLARVVQQLETSGATEIVVVTDIEEKKLQRVAGARLVPASTEQLWRTAVRTFEDMESAGIHGVAVLRGDGYAEINWQAALAHHMHFRNRVTRIWHGESAADIYMVSAARRNEAAALMRNGLREERSAGTRYRTGPNEFVNRLRDCHELQTLAKDALYGVNNIRPVGTEKRPGIWIGERARVEQEARLVAPVYVGAYARLHRGAVITRASVLEHHVAIDCGSVVEDSHIQPYTAIGAGLDVVRSIADGGKLYHLKHRVLVATPDPKLLRERKESATARTAQAAAALVAYMPAMVMNAVRRKQVAVPTCNSPRTLEVVPSTNHPQSQGLAKLAPGLAVMRRYGNE